LVSDTDTTFAIQISVLRPAFDAAFYLARNPDVREKGLDPVEHYALDGWRNGLNPNSEFDTRFYLAGNPDVAASGVNPFYHYLVSGKAEGRFPNEQARTISVIRPQFDAKYYLARNPKLRKEGLDPVQHYVKEGWTEGLNPNRNFDTRGYLRRYPDVAEVGVNPFYHYIVWGQREERIPHGENWLDASAKMLRKFKTMYIDAKYGYPLTEKIGHIKIKNNAGAYATWASGDYDQLRTLETMTSPYDVMVDIGCGQGRVINYWLEKGFNNKIVGVESDEAIANATRERLKKYKNVEIICGDATKCTPLDATFIYMFNPFDFDVTSKFADYLWEHRDQYLRNNLQILLYNCESFAAFDEDRFIRRRVMPHGRIPYDRAVIWLRDR
jgi:hypothetical protein